MLPSEWTPRTPEDRLLALYLAANPGLLFLEVEVGQGDDYCGPRRLDGLLVPGGENRVRAQGTFSRADVVAAVQGQHVHVLEAKRKLNRTVIGQVQVGVALFRRDFSPASVQGVAVCALGNPDLEWYCREQDIQTALYPVDLPRGAVCGESWVVKADLALLLAGVGFASLTSRLPDTSASTHQSGWPGRIWRVIRRPEGPGSGLLRI